MNPRALPAPPESCGVLLRKPLTQKTLRSGTPGFEFPNSLIGREQFNSSLFGNSNSLFCCLAPRKTAASNAKLPRVIPMICSKIQNFLRQKNSLVSREFGFNYSLKVLALRPRSSCASQKILVRLRSSTKLTT